MNRTSILRRSLAAAGCAALAVFFLLACATPNATSRLASTFALDDVSTEESVEAGLLAKLPVGTPQADVEAFLERSGIGRDGWSERHGPGGPGVDDDTIFCKFDFVHESLEAVNEGWGIWFRFDGRSTLRAIDAQRWLKGGS